MRTLRFPLAVKHTTGPGQLTRIVVPFQIKADAVDKDARTFEGLAAVFGNRDLGDDIIQKGAFSDTIAEWKTSGEAMPLLNSHNQWDVMSALGQALTLKETKDGLQGKWEVIDGPDGDAVLARLRPSKRTGRPVVGKMSIGFEPMEWKMVKDETARFGQIRHLMKIKLHEVSLVLFPMNPEASIDAGSVKMFMDTIPADGAKLDLMTKQELRRLVSRIGGLLSTKKAEPGAAPAPKAKKDSTETPAAPPAEPSGDEEELTQLPPETDDDESSAEEQDAGDASDDTDEADAGAADGDDDEGGEAEQEQPASDSAEKGVYRFQEALAQRLKGTLLKNRVSTITSQRNS